MFSSPSHQHCSLRRYMAYKWMYSWSELTKCQLHKTTSLLLFSMYTVLVIFMKWILYFSCLLLPFVLSESVKTEIVISWAQWKMQIMDCINKLGFNFHKKNILGQLFSATISESKFALRLFYLFSTKVAPVLFHSASNYWNCKVCLPFSLGIWFLVKFCQKMRHQETGKWRREGLHSFWLWCISSCSSSCW